MAEGAPLLREYGSKAHRGFESLPLRHFFCLTQLCHLGIILPPISAPVAQLDRVPGYEPGGHTFESCRAHHILFVVL